MPRPGCRDLVRAARRGRLGGHLRRRRRRVSDQSDDPVPRTGPGPVDLAAGLRMYDDFLAAHPEVPRRDDTEVVCFGDTPELADEILGFIVGGAKRATATLA